MVVVSRNVNCRFSAVENYFLSWLSEVDWKHCWLFTNWKRLSRLVPIVDSDELFFQCCLCFALSELTKANVVSIIVVFFLRGGMDSANGKVTLVNCVPESFCYRLKDKGIKRNILKVFNNICHFTRGANVWVSKLAFSVTSWNGILFHNFCNIFVYPGLFVGVVWIECRWWLFLYLFLILDSVLKFFFFRVLVCFLYLLGFYRNDFLHFNERWIRFSQVKKRKVKFLRIRKDITFLKMAFWTGCNHVCGHDAVSIQVSWCCRGYFNHLDLLFNLCWYRSCFTCSRESKALSWN